MGGYVQMDKDLEDDPRVTALTDRLIEHWLSLGVPETLKDAMRPQARDASLGALYRLWRHADTHLKSHNRLEAPLHHIAEVTGLPVTVLRHFPSHWLLVHPGDVVELPNYSDKNALLNKDERRSSGRERTARWRRKQREQRDAICDAAGDASQRHNSVTTGPGPVPNPDPNLKIPPTPQGWRNGHTAGRERSLERQRKDASRAAWVKAEIARKANDLAGLRQREPVIAEAIQLLGGFQAIGMTNTDRMPQVRTRFRELYEQLLERPTGEEG